MNYSIKAILLAICAPACGLASVLGPLHVNNPTQAITVRAPQNRTARVMVPVKRAALRLKQVHALISAAARKHGVPLDLVKSIVATESNFRCNVVSAKGAIGLMQLLPSTARQYAANPRVPAQNVDAGTRYLRFLIEKYRDSSSPLENAIAAYNAGFGAVDRYNGVPPFRETQDYVERVLTRMRQYQNSRSKA
jgi:soluble lytic murein transglycosylase-like protein